MSGIRIVVFYVGRCSWRVISHEICLILARRDVVRIAQDDGIYSVAYPYFGVARNSVSDDGNLAHIDFPVGLVNNCPSDNRMIWSSDLHRY